MAWYTQMSLRMHRHLGGDSEAQVTDPEEHRGEARRDSGRPTQTLSEELAAFLCGALTPPHTPAVPRPSDIGAGRPAPHRRPAPLARTREAAESAAVPV